MTFAAPQLLLFPILLIALYLWRRRAAPAVRHPDAGFLQQIPQSLRLRMRWPLLTLLSVAAICALTIAAARPYRSSSFSTPEKRRNIMLAIDISGSMRSRDFKTLLGRTSRLQAVKEVLSRFIADRTKDRLGLVVFGTNAFLQSPLTSDHSFLIDMISRLEVGMAGEDTAIGDGIGLSIKRIEDVPGETKAIILLTDGVNRTGQVSPIKAASVARDLGIKIHTVGIGSEDSAAGSSQGYFPFFQTQGMEFDEETLKKIAEITGGIYFNASSLERLQEVYQEIDKLETTEQDDPGTEVRDELFAAALFYALPFYLLLLLLSRTILLKVP